MPAVLLVCNVILTIGMLISALGALGLVELEAPDLHLMERAPVEKPVRP